MAPKTVRILLDMISRYVCIFGARCTDMQLCDVQRPAREDTLDEAAMKYSVRSEKLISIYIKWVKVNMVLIINCQLG